MIGAAERDVENRAVTALRQLFQAGDAYRQQVADQFGIGLTESQAIGHLLAAGELGQTELAVRLGITTGAVTALVDRLEREQLADRHPHPQDRRRAIIRLAPRAHELVEHSREWTRRAFENIGEAELEGLVVSIQRMAASLQQQAGALRAR